MKTSSLFLPRRSNWLLEALVFWFAVDPIVAAADQPSITAVQFNGQSVVVKVRVPSGIEKVTLESRSRFGAGSWVPRSVSRLDGNGGDVTFRLAPSSQMEILRVRTDSTEPLPASFYSGTNSFLSGASTVDPGSSLGPVSDAAPGVGSSSPDGTGSTRTVVESDIWSLTDNTLYFFNQYRGLQVIDLSTPDSPIVKGTYALPASGEQMYLLGDKYVVLLAQDNCSTAVGGGSQAVVLDVGGAVPSLVATLPISGWIQESRMVGSALYVASQVYRPVTGSTNGAWESGSTISSFDLSTPDKPVTKDSLWYLGYGNVINATDEFLFVVVQGATNWMQSVVHCIDISAPDGSMKDLAAVTPAGTVPDKFKINQSGDVLSIISENWNSGRGGVSTVLETFSLADPTAPAKLGRLEFPQREQLHATRFDGTRVYIVTFYQVDPLWIVDLSDPTAPRIAGQLEVPGWSTYIQPLGDRLVAIGVNGTNDWRVAVSLFDVQDPAKPALLSKVPLGVNYSWSEASNDEKAFGVLPDSGLILVPYQGYETNGYASRVQLIDLTSNTLRARGTIEHSFQPRRATLYNDRVYSISGKELLAVDAGDRDHPAIRSDLEISWSADRVFVAGDYVLEVANGNNWYGWWSQSSATPPSIRVTKTSDPEGSLNVFVLTNDLPVIGATLQDGKLYLAQGASSGGGPIVFDATGGSDSTALTNSPSLFLSVLDVSTLPNLTLAGQTQTLVDPLGWSASLSAVWPRPGLLVWSGGGSGLVPLLVGGVGGIATGVSGPIGIGRPWWGGTGGRLFAFDVSAASSPAFMSEVNLTTNSWWSFSPALTANGLIYISHENSEFLEGVTLPGQQPPAPIVTVDKDTGQPITNQPPVGIWIERYYLDVIDYGDPQSPTLRSRVNIPGQLNGLGQGGALLYTVGSHWTNWVTDWSQWLDASAYDGVSASLVGSLPLPADWPHPILVSNTNVFVARPDTASSTSTLETWILAETGKYTQTGKFGLGSTAENLALFDNLLVAQLASSTVLLDATNPSSLVAIGKGQAQNCLYYDLTEADGRLDLGLWLPLGDYGVWEIPVSP